MIFEASIAENDIDLYASNLVGIPILARAGSEDTNVPTFHSRRLIRIIDEWHEDPNAATLIEDKGKGHWYEGILNDDIAQSFLDKYLTPEQNPGLLLPKFPEVFEITTLNPASSGAKVLYILYREGSVSCS